MADFVFNIAKGRIVEFYNNVKSNTPANSAFILIPVDVAAVSDATIKDFDTFSAITGGGVTERSATGWNRKTIDDTALAALPAPDDVNDRYDVDMPDQTWTAVTAGAVTDLILCYDADTTGGTDANLLPLLQFDFAITPDGSDVVAVVAATGFFRAS
jgi:hypothetical protein